MGWLGWFYSFSSTKASILRGQTLLIVNGGERPKGTIFFNSILTKVASLRQPSQLMEHINGVGRLKMPASIITYTKTRRPPPFIALMEAVILRCLPPLRFNRGRRFLVDGPSINKDDTLLCPPLLIGEHVMSIKTFLW